MWGFFSVHEEQNTGTWLESCGSGCAFQITKSDLWWQRLIILFFVIVGSNGNVEKPLSNILPSFKSAQEHLDSESVLKSHFLDVQDLISKIPFWKLCLLSGALKGHPISEWMRPFEKSNKLYKRRLLKREVKYIDFNDAEFESLFETAVKEAVRKVLAGRKAVSDQSKIVKPKTTDSEESPPELDLLNQFLQKDNTDELDSEESPPELDLLNQNLRKDNTDELNPEQSLEYETSRPEQDTLERSSIESLSTSTPEGTESHYSKEPKSVSKLEWYTTESLTNKQDDTSLHLTSKGDSLQQKTTLPLMLPTVTFILTSKLDKQSLPSHEYKSSESNFESYSTTNPYVISDPVKTHLLSSSEKGLLQPLPTLQSKWSKGSLLDEPDEVFLPSSSKWDSLQSNPEQSTINPLMKSKPTGAFFSRLSIVHSSPEQVTLKSKSVSEFSTKGSLSVELEDRAFKMSFLPIFESSTIGNIVTSSSNNLHPITQESLDLTTIGHNKERAFESAHQSTFKSITVGDTPVSFAKFNGLANYQNDPTSFENSIVPKNTDLSSHKTYISSGPSVTLDYTSSPPIILPTLNTISNLAISHGTPEASTLSLPQAKKNSGTSIYFTSSSKSADPYKAGTKGHMDYLLEMEHTSMTAIPLYTDRPVTQMKPKYHATLSTVVHTFVAGMPKRATTTEELTITESLSIPASSPPQLLGSTEVSTMSTEGVSPDYDTPIPIMGRDHLACILKVKNEPTLQMPGTGGTTYKSAQTDFSVEVKSFLNADLLTYKPTKLSSIVTLPLFKGTDSSDWEESPNSLGPMSHVPTKLLHSSAYSLFADHISSEPTELQNTEDLHPLEHDLFNDEMDHSNEINSQSSKASPSSYSKLVTSVTPEWKSARAEEYSTIAKRVTSYSLGKVSSPIDDVTKIGTQESSYASKGFTVSGEQKSLKASPSEMQIPDSTKSTETYNPLLHMKYSSVLPLTTSAALQPSTNGITLGLGIYDDTTHQTQVSTSKMVPLASTQLGSMTPYPKNETMSNTSYARMPGETTQTLAPKAWSPLPSGGIMNETGTLSPTSTPTMNLQGLPTSSATPGLGIFNAPPRQTQASTSMTDIKSSVSHSIAPTFLNPASETSFPENKTVINKSSASPPSATPQPPEAWSPLPSGGIMNETGTLSPTFTPTMNLQGLPISSATPGLGIFNAPPRQSQASTSMTNIKSSVSQSIAPTFLNPVNETSYPENKTVINTSSASPPSATPQPLAPKIGPHLSSDFPTFAPLVTVPLNFHITGVSYNNGLQNKTTEEYKTLEREVLLLLNKVFATNYQQEYLHLEVLGFLPGSVIVISNIVFDGRLPAPSGSDIVRTMVSDDTLKNPFFAWNINISTVECQGYTPKNLEPDTLSLSFVVVHAGYIAVSSNQQKQSFLASLQEEVIKVLSVSFPVTSVPFSQIRDVHGHLEVTGTIYVNSSTHTDVKALLLTLLSLANSSVDLQSITVDGLRNELLVCPISFRLLNKQFVVNLLDTTSPEFKELSKDLSLMVQSALHEDHLLQVMIREFNSGSVVCKGELIYRLPAPGSGEILRQFLENLKSNGMPVYRVDFQSITIGDSSSKPSNKYTDFPGFGVAIIVMCGLCILISPALVYVCYKTRMLGHRNKANIQRRHHPEEQSRHFEMDNRAFRASIEQP